MKEESQLEDMRAALRGERERAERARERSAENVRALIESPPDPTPKLAPPAAAEPETGFRRLFRRR
jgi:hypothetical protein